MSYTKLIAAAMTVVAALMGGSLIFASSVEPFDPSTGSGRVLFAVDVVTPTVTITPTNTVTPTATVTPSATVTSTNSVSTSLRIAQAIADFFSTHQLSNTVAFSITADAVLDLKQSGMGYGEIVKALYYASVSGGSVEAIVDMRESGMGWGEIKKTAEDVVTGKRPSMGSIMSGLAKEKNKDHQGSEATPTSTPVISTGGDTMLGSDSEKGGPPPNSNAGGRGKDSGDRVQGSSGDHGQGKGNSSNAPGKQK